MIVAVTRLVSVGFMELFFIFLVFFFVKCVRFQLKKKDRLNYIWCSSAVLLLPLFYDNTFGSRLACDLAQTGMICILLLLEYFSAAMYKQCSAMYKECSALELGYVVNLVILSLFNL